MESFSPAIGLFGLSTTAPATTEPTKGPRPASSTPQIQMVLMRFYEVDDRTWFGPRPALLIDQLGAARFRAFARNAL